MKICKKMIAVFALIMIIAGVFAPAASAAGAKNYVLLGDSIAYGQGIANSQDACYGRIVANTNGYNYANYSVDGYTSGALLKYLDVDFVAAGVRKANIIQISIGGNDFLTSNMLVLLFAGKLGIDAPFDSIGSKFSENFSAIISKIRSLNSSARILVQTVYNPADGIFSDVYQKGADTINNAIRGYLSSHKGAFSIVDVASAFAGHAGEYIAADTIHPNSKGNLVIAQVTLKKLRDLGLGSKTVPVIKTEAIDWTGSGSSKAGIFSYFTKLFSKYMGILFS